MAGAIGLTIACLALLFLVWAIGHEWRRMGWHQDEQEAERGLSLPPARTPVCYPPSPEIFTDATVHWHTHRTPDVMRRLCAEAADRADRQEARHTAHLGES